MQTTAPHLPPDEGEVLSTAELLGSGHTRASLAAAVSSGRVLKLRRGYFWIVPGSNPRHEVAALHRAKIAAALQAAAASNREVVLAGPSAAIWCDLPWVGPAPDDITTVGAATGHAGPRGLLRPIGVMPTAEIHTFRGALVTSPAWTALHAARLSPSRTGLVVADAVLHRQLATADELRDAVVGIANCKGVGRAKWCVKHADGLSESPGESISRYAMIRARLPMPELQVRFELPSGMEAWVDFFWPRVRLVGEFDGATKYRSDERGREAADVVLAEKWREDGLRELGLDVVRWSWAEAWNPAALIARLRGRMG